MRSVKDPEVIAAFTERLRSELETTVALIEESKDFRAPVELDQQSVGRLSRMDSVQQQEMAKDITRRRQHRKVKIELALARIRDGEFGYCSDCGEPIAVRRLEIDPTFEQCIGCAS